MRIYAICLLVLAASLAAFAADETAAQLAMQADSASLDQQPGLYLKAAHLQLKAADAHYSEGKVDDAVNDVKLLTQYADKAADTSIRSGRKLKEAEFGVGRF